MKRMDLLRFKRVVSEERHVNNGLSTLKNVIGTFVRPGGVEGEADWVDKS